ncbi:MAG: DUF1801 domain-containing protein [Chitinophagales bacterium]|nr:DUF1801 domain-containing protein [Chitinophagales bacterium]
MNPKVDFYFKETKRWQQEIAMLRKILLDGGLDEELKWGSPCYTMEHKNIVLIHVFKEYCALLFFKGALMKDPEKILVQQSANVQASRQIRFTNLPEITRLRKILKAYVLHAMDLEKSGLKVTLKKTNEFPMAAEFKRKSDSHAALKKAFYALTPGRQRGYLLYFSAAKQTATREARVTKCIQQILDGKGLND